MSGIPRRTHKLILPKNTANNKAVNKINIIDKNANEYADLRKTIFVNGRLVVYGVS